MSIRPLLLLFSYDDCTCYQILRELVMPMVCVMLTHLVKEEEDIQKDKSVSISVKELQIIEKEAAIVIIRCPKTGCGEKKKILPCGSSCDHPANR